MNIDITQVPPTSAVIEQHRVKLGVKERRKTLVLGFLFVTAPLAFAVSASVPVASGPPSNLDNRNLQRPL